MQLIFLTISIVITILIFYGIGRAVTNSHKEMIRHYRESSFLVISHIILSMLMIILLFGTLCAFNYFFWHLSFE